MKRTKGIKGKKCKGKKGWGKMDDTREDVTGEGRRMRDEVKSEEEECQLTKRRGIGQRQKRND